MRDPIPRQMSAQLSHRAVVLARQSMSRRGWSPANDRFIEPMPGVGRVGIRCTSQVLMYQNRGIRPFLMTALEGRTVPIKGRLFRVRGVGLPGMGWQDRRYVAHKGPIWRRQRWRHPGIEPLHFLENAISQAILENTRRMVTDEVIDGLKEGGR